MEATCLSAMACFFFWSALLALDCFCEDFFWFDFGDLSPMILIFCYGIDCLRHVIFSAAWPIVLVGGTIVNAGGGLILVGKGVGTRFSPTWPKDSCR